MGTYIPGETITYGDEQWICTTSTSADIAYTPTTLTASTATITINGSLEPNRVYWETTESRPLLDEVIKALEDKVKLKPMICKCCGGTINRDGMFCDFCGTKYKLGVEI